MNKTGKRILLGVGGVALATTLFAGGRHYFSDHEFRADWMVHKITQELELNDVQQAKLTEVRDRVLAAKQQVHEGKSARHEMITTLLSQPQLDQQKILDLIDERTAAMRQQAPNIVEAMGEFYDSLTAEQREELREHITERMDRHHFGHHS